MMPSTTAAKRFRVAVEARDLEGMVALLAPDAVLALGDLQYDDGAPEKYAASYAPTWGRFASITSKKPCGCAVHQDTAARPRRAFRPPGA